MTESQELLLTLVKRPSTTPNDMGCQDIVAQRLSVLGFCCERLNYHATSNLWAVLGEEAPSICFIGHTDVVPVGDEKNGAIHLFQEQSAAVNYMLAVLLI